MSAWGTVVAIISNSLGYSIAGYIGYEFMGHDLDSVISVTFGMVLATILARVSIYFELKRVKL